MNTYRAAVLALFFAGAILLGTSAVSAATITIININDSGPGSLRQALVNANDGDTINFDSSLNGQRIKLTSGELNVDKDVTISGPGTKNLAVDGNAQSRVFNVNPGKTVTIDGLTVANGVNVFGSGGGIYNNGGALTVTNCTFSGNVAYDGGGGIANHDDPGGATLTVTNCTFSGNSAVHGGGAIGNLATLTVTKCTISGNSASCGGGLANRAFNHDVATMTVTNCTISGNISTGGSCNGGGIGNLADSEGSATLTIANGTISGNSVSGVSNVALNASSAAVETGNTIFDRAGLSGENIFNEGGTVTSLGRNVSSDDGAGFLTGDGDQINTDPLLGPLQDNGGPTFTHALLPGSPAIDAGDPNFTPPPDYDQRGPGFDRVVNGRIDVGSVEIQSAPTPTPTPTATPPLVSISGTVTGCTNAAPVAVVGATMSLTGPSPAPSSRPTDGAGTYTLSGLTSGETYTVTPTKAAHIPGSAGINTVDVVAIQRHFLIIGTPLTGCRLAAADVNGIGGVNTVDVVAVQRFFLGQTTGIANVGKYQFTPASITYTAISGNQTGQNYSAVLFGDVATPFVPRPGVPSQDAPGVPSTVAAVTLPEVAADQSNISAAVGTSEIDAKSNLVGFQGDFTFDERVVTFQSPPVSNAGLTGGNWNVSGNVLLGAGPIRTLRISAYSNDFTPLSGSGVLFNLNMTRVSPAAQSTPLLWAAPPDQFIFIDADLNTLNPGSAAPGSVTPSPGKRK